MITFGVQREFMIDWSLNLRYLLWKKDIPQDNWVKKIVECLNSDNYQRAEKILRELKPSVQELENIKKNIPLTEDEYMGLMNIDLIELAKVEQDLDVWQENFLFLLEKISSGEKGKFTAYINADISNFSKWKKKTQKPARNKQTIVKKYFNLSSDINLEQDLLFLSLDPISIEEKRQWICNSVNNLNSNTIQELFPAFKRLLKDP